MEASTTVGMRRLSDVFSGMHAAEVGSPQFKSIDDKTVTVGMIVSVTIGDFGEHRVW